MATQTIPQSVLKRIALNRATLEKLARKLEADEAIVLSALKAGSPVAPGLFSAEIKLTERRTTAWKAKAIEVVDEVRGDGEGEKWASRVIAATKPSTSEKLVVMVAGLE
jgi:hypothetical protein